MEILQAERALDPQRFDGKLYQLHLEVMTTLAEMLARDCRTGHCEVCHGSCVKPALPDVSLSAAELRGASRWRSDRPRPRGATSSPCGPLRMTSAMAGTLERNTSTAAPAGEMSSVPESGLVF